MANMQHGTISSCRFIWYLGTRDQFGNIGLQDVRDLAGK